MQRAYQGAGAGAGAGAAGGHGGPRVEEVD